MEDESSNLDDELRAELSASFEDEGVTEQVTESAEAPEDDAPEEAESEGRARDDKGRFAKKIEEAGDDEQPAPDVPDDVQIEAEAEVPADDTLRPPSSWSAGAKSRWNDIDEDIRREVLKREEDIHNGIGQYREKAQFADTLNNVINPYMPMIQAEGGTPETAISALLNAAYQLRQDPEGTLRALAQQYGVSLGQQEQEFQDPALSGVHNELNALKQQLHQQQMQQRQAQQQAMQSVQTEAGAELQAFQSNPQNIYFEDVRNEMALYVRHEGLSLQDAYDKACWANPDVRAAITAQQQREADKKRVDAAKQKAANAAKAGGAYVTGEGAAGESSREMTLREELAANF